MNQQMYRAAATQHNLEVLASRGLLIWGPDSGSQACGDIGPGRMLDPLTIGYGGSPFFARQRPETSEHYDYRRSDA